MISVSSPQRPDLPATFESLNDDTLTTTLHFVGKRSYKSFGVLNKHCRKVYLSSGMTKETFVYGYAPLSAIKDKIERAGNDPVLHERVGKAVLSYNRRDVLDWALQQRNKYALTGICRLASREGRIDILGNVWSWYNVERQTRSAIFRSVERIAAENGKLNVLKWKSYITTYNCEEIAARYGHLNILQWLREEKGLLWNPKTFRTAAEKGYLNILQWLHDEGCPWPDKDNLRVREHDIKPEVEDWLRSNGYGDRVVH